MFVRVIRGEREVEEGGSVGGELVKLEDRTNGDATYGSTSSDGCVIFFEGTGLPPCSNHTLLLPNSDVDAVDLGCVSNGDYEYTFTLPPGELDWRQQG